MSVSYLFAPTELKRGRRWLNSWLPSRRLGMDPLQDLRIDERYAPVSIANWKLVPSVAENLLARRVIRPLTLVPGRRLTVVIPYRDRADHLREMLPALSVQLTAQGVQHRILVVEQTPGGLFNRGRLLNVGMHFAAGDTDYYCLHDVDALPQTATYLCPSQPLRLVNKIMGAQGEREHNAYYFSGAVSIRKEQALAVNGFSNDYWGWGKEDDDFFFRLLLAGYLCYYDIRGVFQDLPNPRHQQVRRNGLVLPEHVRRNRRHRSRLLRGLMDPAKDGLSTLRYHVTSHAIESVEGSAYERLRVRW